MARNLGKACAGVVVALLGAGLSGCASPTGSGLGSVVAGRGRGADAQRLSIAAAGAIDTAAAQVRRCYRTPRVASAARQFITRLRVRYAPDGALVGLPTIVRQSGVTPANQAYAEAMGEAAILSVIRCSPLRLPPELYVQGWNEFDLTFSPSAAV